VETLETAILAGSRGKGEAKCTALPTNPNISMQLDRWHFDDSLSENQQSAASGPFS
jgi:hypothetical protein